MEITIIYGFLKVKYTNPKGLSVTLMNISTCVFQTPNRHCTFPPVLTLYDDGSPTGNMSTLLLGMELCCVWYFVYLFLGVRFWLIIFIGSSIFVLLKCILLYKFHTIKIAQVFLFPSILADCSWVCGIKPDSLLNIIVMYHISFYHLYAS